MEGRLNEGWGVGGGKPGAGRLFRKLLEKLLGRVLQLDPASGRKRRQNTEIFRTRKVTEYWGQRQQEESGVTPEFCAGP